MDKSCSLLSLFYNFSEVDVDTDLNPIILKEIVYECAHKRKDIGTFLKITRNKIAIIESSAEDNEDRFMKMITAWSQKDNGTGSADRTAQCLYDAVIQAGFPDEAKAFKVAVVALKKKR